LTTYLAVFLAALLAATILPFSSEVAVGAAVVAGSAPLPLWLWASLGNTVGALINGALGRLLTTAEVRRRLRIKTSHYEQAQAWFRKWGVWSLLLAWVPVVGDALTVVAGALRVRWWIFATLVFAGKGARYAVLIYALMHAPRA